MKREKTRRSLRRHSLALAAWMITVAGVVSGAAQAATLPPPPVSPAPVTDYEYDAKGNLTKVGQGQGHHRLWVHHPECL